MSFDLTDELLNTERTSAADQVDAAAASAGEIPPGKYPARLEGATRKEVAGLSMWEMYFLITGGQYRGRKVKYALWTSSKGTDKDGCPLSADDLDRMKQQIINEFDHAGRVLGLKTKVAQTGGGKAVYKTTAGKHDFRDCIGAECVVETKLRAASDPGDTRKFPEVVKFGLHAYGDPKAKGIDRPAAGSLPAATAPAPNAAATESMDDLVAKV
jgi:hypothetical protein